MINNYLIATGYMFVVSFSLFSLWVLYGFLGLATWFVGWCTFAIVFGVLKGDIT